MIMILKEPYGNTYKSLISLAMNTCDEFILVKRDQVPLYEKGYDFLHKLKPYLKEIKKQERWPGTQLLGHYADVYYYECHEQCVDILTEHTENLYSWLQPYLPEDLCFFKGRQEWLGTVSHEKMGWINTNLGSEIEKLKGIHQLKTRPCP